MAGAREARGDSARDLDEVRARLVDEEIGRRAAPGCVARGLRQRAEAEVRDAIRDRVGEALGDAGRVKARRVRACREDDPRDSAEIEADSALPRGMKAHAEPADVVAADSKHAREVLEVVVNFGRQG